MLRVAILLALISAAHAKLWTLTRSDKHAIVKAHNDFRAAVRPPASNMEVMVWDKDAARTAAKLAAKCRFDHDEQSERTPASWSHKGCGQNLKAAAGFRSPTWPDAVKSWHDEVHNYKYGKGSDNGGVVGHYTQVVWATSSHVGCAAASCSTGSPFKNARNWYLMVCNYCPAGNIAPKGQNPYKFPYKTGSQSCSAGVDSATGLCKATNRPR